MKLNFLHLGVVCDEGSSLVRLFGQIGVTNLETTIEKDREIAAFLAEVDEINPNKSNEIEIEIDFDLNDVNSQVTALQKESSSFIFNNPLKASSSKDHSNETLSRNEPLGIEEEALYAINNTSERRILLLKELNIKLGK